MKREIILAGNWKMNKNPEDSRLFLDKLNLDKLPENFKVTFFVPFIDIETCVKMTKNLKIKIGAQNFHWEDSGEYTGEISISMLESVGTKSLLLGHSDRRYKFLEDDEIINKKLKKALKYNMDVVLCVGEKLDYKEKKKSEEYIKMQLEKALKNIDNFRDYQLFIAYEPVWAIGTGKSASSKCSNDLCKFIKNYINKMYKQEKNLSVLYGGSVNKENCREILEMPYIDGILIGKNSLYAEDFQEIMNELKNII